MAIIISTDWHLNKLNIDSVLNIIDQQIKLAKDYNINTLFGLGDFFDARKAQEEIVLNTFDSILYKFEENNLRFIGIKGNHDCVDNSKSNSYLTPFRYHPNFTLVSDYYMEKFGNVNCHFLSFFEDDTYVDYINKIKIIPNELNYLFTHIGINGYLNNDAEKEFSKINKSLFKKFDKVFSGHFHDKNDIYIGSIMPKNFGEDNDKGCMILNSDGSHEYINLSFKKYEKVIVNIDSFDKKQEQELLQKYSNNQDNIRFEFTGDPSKIKSLDKMKFETVGIDVTTKNKEVEETVNVAEHDEFVTYDNKMILEQEFPEFCEKNELTDIEIGTEYLKQQLINDNAK